MTAIKCSSTLLNSITGNLLVAIALLSGVSIGETAKGTPLLWGDLQPGGYKVGFRVLYKHDHSRTWIRSKKSSTDSGRHPEQTRTSNSENTWPATATSWRAWRN